MLLSSPVICSTGKSGVFPSNFVELIPEGEEPGSGDDEEPVGVVFVFVFLLSSLPLFLSSPSHALFNQLCPIPTPFLFQIGHQAKKGARCWPGQHLPGRQD